MAVGKEIFPKRCWMAYEDNGRLSRMGKALMDDQRLGEWRGRGIEHPCYGCTKDDCGVREVNYHDASGRWISKPKIGIQV